MGTFSLLLVITASFTATRGIFLFPFFFRGQLNFSALWYLTLFRVSLPFFSNRLGYRLVARSSPPHRGVWTLDVRPANAIFRPETHIAQSALSMRDRPRAADPELVTSESAIANMDILDICPPCLAKLLILCGARLVS